MANTKKQRFSTDRQVQSLKTSPNNKPVDYSHKSLPGFMLRVGAKQKSWIVRYTINGKIKTYTLPIPYPTCSLEEATKEYRRIRSEADQGIDPLAVKQIKKSEPTITDLMKSYLAETPLLPKGKQESTRIFLKDIKPTIGHLKATDLERYHIKQLHASIAKRGAPVMANRVIELIRRAFNYAHEEELIALNTFPAIKKIKAIEENRERILNNKEIGLIWAATEKLRPNMKDIHKLLLLLGQRTKDICSMKVSDIDAENKLWVVPASFREKNKSLNILPLPPLAWSIIQPRLNNDKWLFPSKHNTNRLGYKGEGHTKSTKGARQTLLKLSQTDGWTGHDLRRTARTIMSIQGIRGDIAEKVIGHVQTGVEKIYDQYQYINEKKEALQKIEEYILTTLD